MTRRALLSGMLSECFLLYLSMSVFIFLTKQLQFLSVSLRYDDGDEEDYSKADLIKALTYYEETGKNDAKK